MNKILSLKSLYKAYKTSTKSIQPLEDLSLDIHPGEFVIVKGKSGCGKSTLLNIIGGLDSLDLGSITLLGQSVESYNEKEWAKFRNKNIGFIFQNHMLLADFNALENIMIPQLICGTPNSLARDRAMKLLQGVDLENRSDHKITELSGGEMQRIAIARALANQPKLLLADEPIGNLDKNTSLEVLNILKKLCQEISCAILMVSHSDLGDSFADVIYQLEKGQLKVNKRKTK